MFLSVYIAILCLTYKMFYGDDFKTVKTYGISYEITTVVLAHRQLLSEHIYDV